MMEWTACSALHLGGSMTGRGGGRCLGCASLKSLAMVDEPTSCARLWAGADGVERNRFAGCCWRAVDEAARRPSIEKDMMGDACRVSEWLGQRALSLEVDLCSLYTPWLYALGRESLREAADFPTPAAANCRGASRRSQLALRVGV